MDGPPLPVPFHDGGRAGLVRRILAGVRDIAGLEPTQAAADKLLRRFRATPLATLTTEVALLETRPRDHPAWQTLVEALTVHETSFMRDPRQLAMFRSVVLPEMIGREAAAGTRRLRLCSAGCASGEEAYSIAMLTVDAMIETGEAYDAGGRVAWRRPWEIAVIGCDIATSVLERARLAVYETGSLSRLRSLPPQFLHFVPALDGNRCQVRADLRAMVRFETCNLARGVLPAGWFDAVFCRNVMIYLTADARGVAQAALQNAVRPGGTLLLGSTDTLLDAGEFSAVWGAEAVVYRRRPPQGGASLNTSQP